MSAARFLIVILFVTLLSFYGYAQRPKKTDNPSSKPQLQAKEDLLTRHLTAAETYQLSGDLPNAAIENRAVVSIALRSAANLALNEGKLERAIKLLNDSLAVNDDAQTRMSLAIAYMRLSETDKAISEAQNVLRLDTKSIQARYLLGRLFYSKGDYAAALPELERTLINSPDFDTAYALAVTYLNLRQPDRARLLFEEMETALKDKKNGLHVLFGRAYEGAGYYAEAEREFKLELAADPKTPKAHFFIGYIILQHGGSERLAEAGREFDQELLISPQDFYANFFCGVVATSESEHPKAIKCLQKAIALRPKVAEAYLFLGQSQAESGDPAAEKNLRRAIELSPNKDKKDFQLRRSHFLLGRLLIKSGRRAEGEKELAKAKEIQDDMLANVRDEVSKILNQVVDEEKTTADKKAADGIEKGLDTEQVELTPKKMAEINQLKSYFSQILAQAYHNLAVIDAQQGQPESALAKFASAAEWKPDFQGLDRNWGIIAFRSNQFDKAVGPLDRHLKKQPDDSLTRRMLGVSYYLIKSYKEAVTTLKPIEVSLADDPELAYFYGISMIRLDRQAEASAIFIKLTDKNTKSAQARFYAGQGLAILGNFERAVVEFRSAAEIDPSIPQAHYNAGQSLIRLNRLDEAEKEFRLEMLANPNDELAKYSIAYSLLERKTNTDEAISLLREAIATRSNFADARYQLGKALIEKGDVAEAIEHLESAASSDPKKDYIFYQLSIAYRRVSRPVDSEKALKTFRELKEANRREKPSGMGTNANAP